MQKIVEQFFLLNNFFCWTIFCTVFCNAELPKSNNFLHKTTNFYIAEKHRNFKEIMQKSCKVIQFPIQTASPLLVRVSQSVNEGILRLNTPSFLSNEERLQTTENSLLWIVDAQEYKTKLFNHDVNEKANKCVCNCKPKLFFAIFSFFKCSLIIF